MDSRYTIVEEQCDAGHGVYTEYEIFDDTLGCVVGRMYAKEDAETAVAALNARASSVRTKGIIGA